MIPHLSSLPASNRPLLCPIFAGPDGWPGTVSTSPPPLLIRQNGRTVVTDTMLWCRPTHWLSDGAVCGADLVAQCDNLGGHGKPGEQARWLLHEASRQASLCEAPLTLCVPMPTGLSCYDTLVRHAEAAWKFWAPQGCTLELLFSAPDLAHANTDMLLALSALRDLGFGLALECGRDAPACLTGMRRLPITCLRLPAAVVCDLPHSRPARQAVDQVVQEALALDATVLAQCIHSAAQRDVLADLGCDRAQGPLFGPPMPAAAFQAALLRDLEG